MVEVYRRKKLFIALSTLDHHNNHLFSSFVVGLNFQKKNKFQVYL